ncbi:MAG: hypothetical protein OXT67_11320 [Zetaproteobacteria bacterium]|nr:hypothetical protein [Zetaproteobacteria bacterium]
MFSLSAYGFRARVLQRSCLTAVGNYALYEALNRKPLVERPSQATMHRFAFGVSTTGFAALAAAGLQMPSPSVKALGGLYTCMTLWGQRTAYFEARRDDTRASLSATCKDIAGECDGSL